MEIGKEKCSKAFLCVNIEENPIAGPENSISHREF
jgi:hypothetical protein